MGKARREQPRWPGPPERPLPPELPEIPMLTVCNLLQGIVFLNQCLNFWKGARPSAPRK